MIGSLLIANRGEIACRIIRTARAMGVRTVAVYSDADRGALHVRRADEAVHIGASPPDESYLDGEKIIAAARASGAEAIHPGYGFLSENGDFAQDVIDAGLVWVGPKPASIRTMGLKDAAKKLMIAAGVPVTPGYLGEDQSAEQLASEAATIGWPVLIKAVAGGGGKGMRLVDRAEDFAAALASCRREAASAFGDDRVILEKYIFSPRHIEVQVFGDSHGNIVHLFERDCSLQRRHQKLIEEAPAPGMDEATREALCEAAVKAARAVDYQGAGTVEFIADASEGLRADRIWFMEMNTRLQVEHPVTEEVTGVDLVEWQLRVASGEPLPKRQDELAMSGHAIEARLYAEDPKRGFLPSVGQLERFRIPHAIRPTTWLDQKRGWRSEQPYEGLARIDSGVAAGDSITPFYDPLIAKIIWHAEDRQTAALCLARALDQVEIWPVKHNASLLSHLLGGPPFIRGRVHTGFVDEQTNPDLLAEGVSEIEADFAARALVSQSGVGDLAGFRLNAAHKTAVHLQGNGTAIIGHFDCLTPTGIEPLISSEVDGDSVFVTMFGHTIRLSPVEGRGSETAANADGAIVAPMPGRVTSVEVAAGEAVAKGQRLLTMEAMKMEHGLVAPFDGMVSELAAEVGAQVGEGTVLARVEPVASRA